MLQNDLQLKSGVVGGTFLSTILNISLNDILFTVVMAVVGAVVSFFCFLFTSESFFFKKENVKTPSYKLGVFL